MRFIHLLMLIGYLHCAHHDATLHGLEAGRPEAHLHAHEEHGAAHSHSHGGPKCPEGGNLAGDGLHEHGHEHVHQCLCAPPVERLSSPAAVLTACLPDIHSLYHQDARSRPWRDGTLLHQRTKFRPLFLSHSALLI